MTPLPPLAAVTTLPGDARQTLRTLAPKSVHMAVTSPPYWQLRSYLPKDHPQKHLEIGSEPTPALYIASLMDVFDRVREALRDDGTVWVNIADSYSGGGRGGNPAESAHRKQATNAGSLVDPCPDIGIASMNQVGIPWLFAFAMRDRGWLWRDTIIWQKTSAMPSSVDGWRWEKCRVRTGKSKRCDDPSKNSDNGQSPHSHREGPNFVNTTEYSDCPGCPKCSPNDGYVLRKGSWRTTTSHEYIFLFSKTPSYYCDAYAVRTKAKDATINRNNYSRIVDDADEQFAVAHDHEFTGATANLRSVWEIGPEPLMDEKHYATFPSEIPRKAILAGTSAKGVCAKCGAPVVRIVSKTQERASGSGRSGNAPTGKNGSGLQGGGETEDVRYGPIITAESLGWRPSCDCAAGDPTPAVVLDPFGGSGRTALTAIALGRRAILCELNDDYVGIQRRQFDRHMPLFTYAEGGAH